MEYIKKTELNTKKPVGNGIEAPEMKWGSSVYIPVTSADTTNSGTDINVSYSQENRSAKFKNGSQDIPEAGKGQYEEV